MQNDAATRHSRSISHREHDVLELLSNGRSSMDIASVLFLSSHTINDHRKSLMSKLEAKNAAHMIRKGFELQLLIPTN